MSKEINFDFVNLQKSVGKTIIEIEYNKDKENSSSGGEELIISLNDGSEILIYKNFEGNICIEHD